MTLKTQALRLIDVIDRLENCIDAIMSTGDLSQWMSADGIALLNNTLSTIRERKPVLERLINTPPTRLGADFGAEDLGPQIESYESLFFHLTGTLKLARSRQ